MAGKTEPRSNRKMPVFGLWDPRVRSFIRKVGPEVSADIGHDDAVVVGVPTGGVYFAMGLRSYLYAMSPHVDYFELKPDDKLYRLYKPLLGGKKLYVVDDAVNSGKTFNAVMDRLEDMDRRYEIGLKEIKYVVDYDKLGVANFARIRGQDDFYDFMDRAWAFGEDVINYIFRRRSKRKSAKTAGAPAAPGAHHSDRILQKILML